MSAYYSNSNNSVAGQPGLWGAAGLLFLLSVAAYGFAPAVRFESLYGVCLPAPAGWDLPQWGGWALNLAVLALAAFASVVLNREWRFIHDNTVLFASVFLLFTGANPWSVGMFGAGGLFALMVLVATMLLFSQYGERNATRGLFLAFSVLGVGSMMQHAFLLMIPIFVIGAMYLNVLRLKELAACVLGVVAPYWIGIGFGLIGFDDFALPELTNIFTDAAVGAIPFWSVLATALTALLSLLLALSNSVRVFSTNTQTRACNSFFNLLSVALFWYMIFDFSNMTTYLPLFNLMAGIQAAHFFVLNRVRRGVIVAGIVAVFYVALFVLTLYV